MDVISEKPIADFSDDDLIVLHAFDPVGTPAKRRERDDALRVVRKD
jgi:hypothetical protein